MQTDINREAQGFSWGKILVNSQEFEQSPFNSAVFSLKNLADIRTNEDEISAIHPMKREILNSVAEKLSMAIGQYYKQNVSVTISEELIIKVYFS